MVRLAFVGHNNKGRQRTYIAGSHYLDMITINTHLHSHPEHLMLYQEDYRSDGSLKDDLLQHDDWQELLQLYELLEPIHDCSLSVQSTADDSQHGALHDILTTMGYLLNHLEEAKKRLDNPKIVTHFKASVNLGWKKLNYYYNLSDNTPAYRLAIFLHPHYRFKWFEKKWAKKPKWLDKAREVIHTAYN
jgi:hypothetical protein